MYLKSFLIIFIIILSTSCAPKKYKNFQNGCGCPDESKFQKNRKHSSIHLNSIDQKQ